MKDVRAMIGIKGDESAVLEGAFSKNPKVDIIKPWTDLGLSDQSKNSMRTAQRALSNGLWTGFRNPIAHEERILLEQQGLFTYQDSLDALSILSHLRRRIDIDDL